MCVCVCFSMLSQVKLRLNMSPIDDRIRTYQGTENLFPVSIQSLAEAGLYYKGPGDMVRCGYCKKSLKKWAYGDEPMQEHARISPHCSFVAENKHLLTNCSTTIPSPGASPSRKRCTSSSGVVSGPATISSSGSSPSRMLTSHDVAPQNTSRYVLSYGHMTCTLLILRNITFNSICRLHYTRYPHTFQNTRS